MVGEKTTISISTSFATNIINDGNTFIIQYSRYKLHDKPLRPQTNLINRSLILISITVCEKVGATMII